LVDHHIDMHLDIDDMSYETSLLSIVYYVRSSVPKP